MSVGGGRHRDLDLVMQGGGGVYYAISLDAGQSQAVLFVGGYVV